MGFQTRIDQLRQIRGSHNYLDNISTVNEQVVAESSLTLEEDLNVIRTLLKGITGKENWYDASTINLEDSVGSSLKKLIQPVQLNNLNLVNGEVASGLTSGTVSENSLDNGYIIELHNATPTLSSKAIIQLRDKNTNAPLITEDEQNIIGIMFGTEGVINSSLITLEDDLIIKTYIDNAGTLTPYNHTGNVEALIPQRVNFKDIDENALMSGSGFAGAIGSIELGDRVFTPSDLAGYFNIQDDESITDVINKIIEVSSNEITLTNIISNITGIDSDYGVSWTEENYISSTDNFSQSIDKLDMALKIVENQVDNNTITTITQNIDDTIIAGTVHTIPEDKTYDNTNSESMKIYINGSRTSSDASCGGAGLGDYSETSTTEVTFNGTLVATDLVVYEIFKEI